MKRALNYSTNVLEISYIGLHAMLHMMITPDIQCKSLRKHMFCCDSWIEFFLYIQRVFFYRVTLLLETVGVFCWWVLSEIFCGSMVGQILWFDVGVGFLVFDCWAEFKVRKKYVSPVTICSVYFSGNVCQSCSHQTCYGVWINFYLSKISMLRYYF